MARDLKFRQAIFDNGKFEKFHYWGFVDRGFSGPMTGTTGNLAEAKENSQQFTGLKDKAGTPIFEGDILQVAGNQKYEIQFIFELRDVKHHDVLHYGISDYASESRQADERAYFARQYIAWQPLPPAFEKESE